MSHAPSAMARSSGSASTPMLHPVSTKPTTACPALWPMDTLGKELAARGRPPAEVGGTVLIAHHVQFVRAAKRGALLPPRFDGVGQHRRRPPRCSLRRLSV